MKKAINLKVGDPVTCMRRYYLGKPYHGEVCVCNPAVIVVHFYHTVQTDEHGGVERRDDSVNYLPDGRTFSDEPCSLIPGHITPEPLTLPETVEFEKGDRVLAWGFSYAPNHSIKMPGIYIKSKEDGHYVKSSSGNLCKFFHVEPFTEAALYAQFHEPEQPTQPEQPAPVETDDTPKMGDWCLFWDNRGANRLGQYASISTGPNGEHNYLDTRYSQWRHARKIKPSDLSPELWAILQVDKPDSK